jgi:L-glyceraldehyde 3-phosphate reductase
VLAGVEALGKIAKARKQTMSQLALAWVLRRSEVTSALIGVRTLEQLKDCLGTLDNLSFTDKELSAIDAAVAGGMLDGRPATTMPD